MEKIFIENFNLKDVSIERFAAYIDSNGTPLVLPTIFSMVVNREGRVLLSRVKKGEDGNINENLEFSDLSENVIRQYESKLLEFFEYCDSMASSDASLPNVHKHTHAPSEFINKYINEYLIEQEEKGMKSVEQAKVALQAYYNYLAKIGITYIRNLYIRPKQRKKANKNTKRRRAYKYIARQTRSTMLLKSKSLRDELILQFGVICGLRTHENTSLFLNDFTYGKKKQSGFLTMFADLECNPDEQSFKYLLTITKSRRNEGSPSRVIYIPRELLEKCRQYYLLERPVSEDNCLFVNNDPNTKGQAISPSTGTRIFREIKNTILEQIVNGKISELPLHEDNSYQHLRHSFATEKFYELCGDIPHHAITEGHSVVTEIARLMGHKINKKKHAQEITMRYIRSVDEMLIVEGKK
ncbi:site-specific integrase [Pseudoalteromonas sp. JBTF-M23]|uniref:Site-specific integrase n=1 Tax=Pseudoalteromonas caenipelagi TaxID=2726988 RepID=A0A849VH46_9GAMM|nr:site-specific integrase [Pseudoalteromonas caenipelagi]NOU52606.1 site-specific integrase [Pseudoalteromonas caenipelagi]